MKKTKLYIKYSIGLLVGVILSYAILSTIIISKKDIPDDQVENLAMDLKLVNPDEAEFPSVAEMENRLQSYYAGENFTNISVKFSVFLVVSLILITIALSGYKLSKNKQKLKRFAIPAGGLLLVFIFSRVFASSSTKGLHTTFPIAEEDLLNVSTLINATLILLVISFTALGTYRVKHILTK